MVFQVEKKFMEFICFTNLIKKKIMEANQILQSGFLDILFEGRNKLYGAYDLRKTYNQRISKALLAMVLFIMVLVTGFIISKRFAKDKTLIKVISPGLVLQKIAPDKPKTIPKLPHPVHVATYKVTQPVIVKKLVDSTARCSPNRCCDD